MTASRLMIGAMSGTSADGVDVALVDVTGHGLEMKVRLLSHLHHAYPADLRTQIFSMREAGAVTLAVLADVGRAITLIYAHAIRALLARENVDTRSVAGIGAHGQTLYHAPPATIQWFDPSLLAYETGIAVVSDFRRADCAAGGQGAPLVPFADFLLFSHPTKSRVLLNLGGIANITYLPAGGAMEAVMAFDTGSANCVVDHLMRQSGTGEIDLGGQQASRGRADHAVALQAIRNWNGFLPSPPKSADTPEMIRAFESAEIASSRPAPLADRLATACLMSALGVEAALTHLPARPDEIIVSGGGIKNLALMKQIEVTLGQPVLVSDSFGMPTEAKEAVAFAILAAATLDHEPSNVPSVTGASRRVVLGSVTPIP